MEMDKKTRLLIDLRDNPYKYAIGFGFDKLKKHPHNEWLKEMIWGTSEYTLQAHRGSYKTTCLIAAFTIMMILFPKKYIRLFRKTSEDIKEVFDGVRKCLDTNTAKYICKTLWGIDLAIVASTVDSISTNLYSSVSGTPQLAGSGLGGSITGKHATDVFTDDIVNVSDRQSRASREETKLRYQELVNIRNRDGRIFNSGTPWHKEDAFCLMAPPKTYDCYQTGLMSPEDIATLKKSMTASLFAANYELKHINDEGALFKDPQWVDTDEMLMEGRMHIDAAYGGKDTTAITVFAEKDGHYYFYGRCWADSVMNHYGEIKAIHQRFKCGTVFCESNADKGFLAKDLRGLGLLVNTYSETENKFIKICTHLTKIWGNLSFHSQSDSEYMRQILEFQEGLEPDDCPDSAACAARILTRPSPRLHVFG